MSMVDGSVLVVYQGAFLRRSAICVSGLALVVYHRTVMVWAMNVKGTLRWTAFSARFWVSPTPVMFFPDAGGRECHHAGPDEHLSPREPLVAQLPGCPRHRGSDLIGEALVREVAAAISDDVESPAERFGACRLIHGDVEGRHDRLH